VYHSAVSCREVPIVPSRPFDLFFLSISNKVIPFRSENIELGAHQCRPMCYCAKLLTYTSIGILVRDEKAKAKLSSEVDHEIRPNIS
jgi:hypothetical protein